MQKVALAKRNRLIVGVTAGVLTLGVALAGSAVADETTTADNGSNQSASNHRRGGSERASRSNIDASVVTVPVERAITLARREASGLVRSVELVAGARTTDADGATTQGNPVWRVQIVSDTETTVIGIDALTSDVVELPTRDSRSGGRGSSSNRTRSAREQVVIDPATVAISEVTAQATALAQVPGGALGETRLEAGRGTDANPVWHVDVIVDGVETCVQVDAQTGEVLNVRTGRVERTERSGRTGVETNANL